ncbi:MAG: FadR family transcriptional regulator [Desulfarculaceae bacterium]|nr:FadR family transcriptional regulator [Desulfarculaceae bacterium]
MVLAAGKLNKARVSDQVREKVTEMIFSGQLKVGDQLPSEAALAAEFGVSKVPVREAIIGMEQAGLLTIKRGAGGGIFVAEPSTEPMGEVLTLMLRLARASIEELTEARLIIETEVAYLAAQRAQEEEIAALEETIEEYRRSLERGEPRTFSDMDFHLRLGDACNNMVLNLSLKGLVPMIYHSVRVHEFAPKDRGRGIADHQGMLDAIRQRDPGRARELMRDHITRMATFWK